MTRGGDGKEEMKIEGNNADNGTASASATTAISSGKRKRLILIRHAESQNNLAKSETRKALSNMASLKALPTMHQMRLAGSLLSIPMDTDLSAAGERMVRQLRETLQANDFVHREGVQLAVHSHLIRAHRTCNILFSACTTCSSAAAAAADDSGAIAGTSAAAAAGGPATGDGANEAVDGTVNTVDAPSAKEGAVVNSAGGTAAATTAECFSSSSSSSSSTTSSSSSTSSSTSFSSSFSSSSSTTSSSSSLPIIQSELIFERDVAEHIGIRDMKKRIESFKQWLWNDRPESCIVIVGHSAFFRDMLNTDLKMKNCEVRECYLVCSSNIAGSNDSSCGSSGSCSTSTGFAANPDEQKKDNTIDNNNNDITKNCDAGNDRKEEGWKDDDDDDDRMLHISDMKILIEGGDALLLSTSSSTTT